MGPTALQRQNLIEKIADKKILRKTIGFGVHHFYHRHQKTKKKQNGTGNMHRIKHKLKIHPDHRKETKKRNTRNRDVDSTEKHPNEIKPFLWDAKSDTRSRIVSKMKKQVGEKSLLT